MGKWKQLSVGEIEAELARIREMSLPANQAKALARLMWRTRKVYYFDDVKPLGKQYHQWAEEYRGKSDGMVVKEWLQLRNTDPAYDFNGIVGRMLASYDHNRLWWRQKNLTKEIEKARSRVGFIADLTYFFSKSEAIRDISSGR
jgi:hypothetical protein